ncbi:MAG: serine/threonine protein kinase, partial [Candidatus Obscuribacterales bacterium]|nr:serine/threonine protein kinase [Candidatus Obscuribacterales bacterium]
DQTHRFKQQKDLIVDYLKQISKAWSPMKNTTLLNEEKPISVPCSLIPLSQAISFVVVLVALSSAAWLLGEWSGPVGALSIMMQVIFIPVLIASALKLTIKVSPEGVEAKSSFHKQSLFNKAKRPWNDLHSVRLRKMKSPTAILDRIRSSKKSRLNKQTLMARALSYLGKGWGQQGFLILDFKSGGQTAFPLAGFSPIALENLFISLSRWADPMTLNPDVIALQRDILTGQDLQLNDSYTKMWEESLRQRFEVTNFVPLMGGQELRGGEYKILMLLACGGMASAYLARNPEGKSVVVKEMAVPEDAAVNKMNKVHEMFAREAQFLAKLDHPHIVKVLDHFVENSRDYLVVEYITGLTLRQQVQMHGAFIEADVVEIAKQLADIMSYLHSRTPAVIHRDITPDNLLISEPDRHITLIDFGAANEFIGAVTGTLVGKQCYIPPEQFRGHAVPQSDLYAVGATLHFLLTGEDPEPISISHPAEISSDVSSWIDNIVSKLTALEPEERMKSAEDLHSILVSTTNAAGKAQTEV